MMTLGNAQRVATWYTQRLSKDTYYIAGAELKKQDKRPKNDSEKKLKALKKKNQEMRSQIRQLRKALNLAHERIIQLEDVQGDQDVVEVARKIARGKRKKLTVCTTCSVQAVEEFITDLGHKEMVVRSCNSCGEFHSREFREKEIP